MTRHYGSIIRVLLADDQALLRTALATILDTAPDLTVVGQASTGREAVELTRQLRPDVVCMDVRMPEMDGIEATSLITADPELDTRVLVLTTFEQEDYLLRALQAGAAGFLLKNTRPEQLAEGVRVVAAGDALLSPEVTRAVISRALPVVDPSAHVTEHSARVSPARGGLAGALTERETEVLLLVADGLSNDEIAAHLVLGRATVKTHVSSILAKLGLRDRVQAVVFAHQRGLTGGE